jgi:hypothetical protein
MVAGERFAKVPPDALGWICLGYDFGKEVRDNSIAGSSHIGTHGVAIGELGVVPDHLDHPNSTAVADAGRRGGSERERDVAFPEPTIAIGPSSREVLRYMLGRVATARVVAHDRRSLDQGEHQNGGINFPGTQRAPASVLFCPSTRVCFIGRDCDWADNAPMFALGWPLLFAVSPCIAFGPRSGCRSYFSTNHKAVLAVHLRDLTRVPALMAAALVWATQPRSHRFGAPFFYEPIFRHNRQYGPVRQVMSLYGSIWDVRFIPPEERAGNK